ncbi:winged helix-turn-helix transcriptional regulator [Terrisporobacter mayombei]|uniref:HTH hxlR-type domain-containing protein n=1 Tax=Terrisporobacter mayombei TaxID=1541 RepID=A0ABY9PZ31_9FIRM|nr:helix-turn-helix domain-containing protein [Terrisporobacter mayombei]MCC3866720.1 helix-turn-helix transcriptional regulator [Terrisporobacter mayombei]WMT80958.1 hypothetical protein TEMA_12860 [Terrisporobacter mayombei]
MNSHHDTVNMENNFHTIRGKYKSSIICNLSTGRKRFTALQRSIGQVSHKVLCEKLKELESDNLINREYFYEYPPRVEYFLTTKGCEYSKLIKQFEILT